MSKFKVQLILLLYKFKLAALTTIVQLIIMVRLKMSQRNRSGHLTLMPATLDLWLIKMLPTKEVAILQTIQLQAHSECSTEIQNSLHAHILVT